MSSMKRLTFLLSGEHSSIPFSEVYAAIEAEGFSHETDEELDQILTVKTDADYNTLSRRLAMSHWIGEHFCTSRFDNLREVIASSDLIDFLPQSESISVRVNRIKNYLPNVDTQELAEEIANLILDSYDYEVDLEHPGNEIICVLSEGKCVLAVVLARVDRSRFEERKPQKRSVVHPSTMQPNFARVLVNLARTPRDGTFLDPFCGVGGILIEAGLLGAKIIGTDINSELLEGARKNLEEAGLANFKLIEEDARGLNIEKVDAIATDPPYGRQASTGGTELRELYGKSLTQLGRAIKPGGYICITSPSELDLEELARNTPLTVDETHLERVHKSLSRKVYVMRRRGK